MIPFDFIFTTRRLLRSVWGLVVCVVILSIALGSPSYGDAADSGRPQRVLVLSTGSRFSPGFPVVEQGVIDELRKLHAGELEFYSEYLDIVRFPPKSFHGLFRDYLHAKYIDNVPDVIVLVFVGNLVVARHLLHEIFPDTPVVAVGLSEEEFPESNIYPHLTGTVQRSDPAGTIELMLRLQPEIERILLIGGVAQVDRHVMARATEVARSYGGRIGVEIWADRSMADILHAVKVLPPRTAILFTRMFRDGARRAIISSQAAQAIAKVSNVPVYVMSDPMLGTGAVGGSVADVLALGQRAGQMAESILKGGDPRTLPLEVRTQGVPIFDWRALTRWGISASRLPPNSIVRYRTVPIWQQHPWYMAGAVVIFLLQAGLIAGLVVNRLNRRRAEKELRQSEEALEKEHRFLRQVIDIDPNFIFAKDRKGRFTLANRAVADAYGTTVENLIGKTDAEFNPNRDEVEFFHQKDLEVIDTLQERFIPEERITDASGKVRWLQTVKRPIVDKDGSAAQVLGSSTDISARKLAEAELQRNRDELAHMTRVSTLGELVASLAHELNQPLGAILSNAEAAELLLMAESPALDEVREILVDIRNDDRRASEVIRGLRGLLRRQDMVRQSLQINDAVGEVLRLLSIDAGHRSVVLSFEPAENLPPVLGDRVQLQQVILNLVLNAMEATAGQAEETRQVVVRSGPGDGGMIKISVSDSGPGIASEKLPKLFEPFFTTKSEGMGMGLSIARTIVEAHHGRIWAENNPGGGATFHFTLPLAEEA